MIATWPVYSLRLWSLQGHKVVVAAELALMIEALCSLCCLWQAGFVQRDLALATLCCVKGASQPFGSITTMQAVGACEYTWTQSY